MSTVYYDVGTGEQTVWAYWTGDSTCTSGTTTTAEHIWEWWTGGTATITQTQVWKGWVTISSGTANTPLRYVRESQPPAPRVRTAEEIAADEARIAAQRAEWQAAEHARVLARQKAEERAKELFLRTLSHEQRRQFEEHRSVVVVGRQCRYRIRPGRSGNIDVVGKDGVVTHRLCAHPAEMVPDFDTMLSQVLMLTHEEERFVRLANRHPLIVPGEQVLPALH